MRKKIIIVSMLAIFIIMMLPSSYAVETIAIKEKINSQKPYNIADFELDEIFQKYNDPEPSFIILFLLSVIINILRIIKFSIAFFVLIIFIVRKIFGNNTSYSIT